MRVLITGGAGVLGSALVRVATERSDTGASADAGVSADTGANARHQVEVTVRRRDSVTPPGAKRHIVELTQPMAFWSVVERRRPDVVIHTAYSRSDHVATVDITSEVATVCATFGVELIHVSTDALFDGDHAPYDESALPAPVTPYGRAKARCEEIVSENCPDAAIVRTSLIVADDASDGTSAWLVEALRAGQRTTLFHDEFRCPIRDVDLAKLLWGLVDLDAAERRGVWHLVGPERLSRVELGHRIARRMGLDGSLIDEASSDSMPGRRPKDLALGAARMQRWLESGRSGDACWPAPIGSVEGHGSRN
ncbi:MAG: sugar nucleotide-binding protein [Microthrixaceae bacterium]|nr:sugar nucleotide-binding protein [Microthrixaceae bacterium]MCO5311910.1 sugar nucleotide-binding protein [Microthrixaceae bacterium]HPB46169.1 sugar nucleotide-binding protein [Microthrixaceae bacterium]